MTPATESYLVPLLDDYGANDLHIFFSQKKLFLRNRQRKSLGFQLLKLYLEWLRAG